MSTSGPAVFEAGGQAVDPDTAVATADPPDTVESAPGDAAGADTPGQAAATLLPPGDPVELVANNAYFPKARDVIQTAQKKLRIVQFEVAKGDTPALLLAAATKAKERGVDVRVLLDNEVAYNTEVVAQLKAAGVDAKLDSTKLRSHAKVVASEQGFLIGSTNWSTTSMTKNNETNLLVRDTAATTQLHAWFDKLWADSGKAVPMPTGKSAVAPLYADGGYYAVAAPLVDAAKSQILLCTYGMNIDPTNPTSQVTMLAQKLGNAKKRGVQIRVLLDQSGDWAELGNDINTGSGAYLASLGATVHLDALEQITHAKFLIVDGQVVLGSNNWGYGGFVNYHEVGLRTAAAKPVQALAAYFEKLWLNSTLLPP